MVLSQKDVMAESLNTIGFTMGIMLLKFIMLLKMKTQ